MSKKKSTAQHKADGTYQACRHAGDNVSSGAVVSPIPLTESEQHYFDHLAGMFERQNLSTELDAFSVATLAHAIVDYLHHREGARGEGSISVSDKGVEYLSGRHNAMAAAHKRMTQLMSKFGMTPVDRTGLECGADGEADAFDKLLERSMN